MSYLNDAFCRGYKDYVNGFNLTETNPDYSKGYQAARSHFMNDIPYDHRIVGDMW